MAGFNRHALDANLNRRDITASPVGGSLPYTSSFASNIFDAMSTGFKAIGSARDNDARDGLYEAQTKGVNLDNDAKQRQVDGNRLLAGILSKAQGDPNLAKFMIKTALENDIDPEKIAKYMAFAAGNSQEPVVAGQSNEQTIVGNRGVFASGLNKGESFDVNRAQGILDREDETDRYKSDNSLKGTKYSADKSSGATIASANIRAQADKDIAAAKPANGGTTTRYDGYSKMSKEDFDLYVDDAIRGAPSVSPDYQVSPAVKSAIQRSFEARVQNGEAPISAAQNAVAEVLPSYEPNANKGIFNKQDKQIVAPGILTRTGPQPTTKQAPRVKTVTPGRASSPAAASAPMGASKPAPAAAPKLPKPGDVVGDFKYKGPKNPTQADLRNQANWEAVGA